MQEIPSLDLPLQDALTHLERVSAQKRLEWAYEKFGSKLAITTSFGIQSSVLLHMLHTLKVRNTIKVIWVDTGYLPAETYKYADSLSKLLNLNIIVAQSKVSPARMEALYGKLWEKNSVSEMEKYLQIRKIDPLEQTLQELKVNCWASGVRSHQTANRSGMKILDTIRNRFSIRPLLDWSQKDVFYYMQEHNLPQHPLFEQGYSTVGDWHSSAPDSAYATGRETRFGGLKQECGIHLDTNNDTANLK